MPSVKYDPTQFEDIEPVSAGNASVSDYLTGKEKIPPGVAGLLSPQSKDFQDKLGKEAVPAVAGSFLPAGTANPLAKPMSWLAEKTGLGAVADKLMQRAVGIKKYLPGVGDTLVDEGLMGTRGQMQNQVHEALARRGNQIGRAVDEIPGNLTHDSVSQAVADNIKKFSTPSGAVPEAVRPQVEAIARRASDIANRPTSSAKELFGYKKIAQGEGYNAAGNSVERLQGKLAQSEASAYGDTLAKAHANAFPGSPQPLSDLNASYGALKKAKVGLSTKPGIGIMDLLNRTIPSSAAQSIGAQAITGAGRAAQQAPLRSLDVKALLDQEPGTPRSVKYDPNQFEDVK